MKKSYLMIAAAAGLMLTACSQEDDFVAQNAATVEQGDGAVLFDTYLSNTSTRAGQTGMMTTTTLQNTGFGILGYKHALTEPTATGAPFTGFGATCKPDFMYNQFVSYQASNWIYSPLKYWPNETIKDDATNNTATSTDLEGVSFFAYAPYVEEDASAKISFEGVADKGFSFKATGSNAGLQSITNNTAAGDPKISYLVADGNASGNNIQPSGSVDLLWGVSSGFTYHPVYKSTNAGAVITQTAGKPITMIKPDIDEKIKFDFKHALARMGMTVVGAFDQVAQGGILDTLTRVTIEKIEISSTAFARRGILNLNNTTPNQALWESTVPEIDSDNPGVITITNIGEMNPHLKYMNDVTAKAFPRVKGVIATPQNVIVGANPYVPVKIDGGAAAASTPKYDGVTTYFILDGSTYKPVTYDATYLAYGAVETGYAYYEANADESVYTKATSPIYNPSKHYVQIKADEGITSTSDASYDATKLYYTKDGDNYTIATVPAVNYATTEKYYTLDIKPVTIEYKSGVYYTVDTTPGYFMVIPRNGQSASANHVAVPSDAKATVTITYYVTTVDGKLEGGTSEVKNVISQDITLKGFTNGKSYNLKLILGLTSVKVDAEVSNWEVGTIASDLPRNLEQ